MKSAHRRGRIVLAALLSLAASGAFAAESTYWTDSTGAPVLTSNGSCWQGMNGENPASCTGKPTDSDGDGVADAKDHCPNTAAGVKVDANGCPLDSDGDGVPDSADSCPNTPAGATVNAKGCIDHIVMHDLNFGVNKAALSPASRHALDAVADKVVGNRNITAIIVTGYTDNTGAAAYNRKLSAERARAVADYFVKKGVPADLIHARGMGETNPLADNTTAAGRLRNRRVEIDFKM